MKNNFGIQERGAAYRVVIPRSAGNPNYIAEGDALQAWVDETYDLENRSYLPTHFRLNLYMVSVTFAGWDVYFPKLSEATMFWLRWMDGWDG